MLEKEVAGLFALKSRQGLQVSYDALRGGQNI